MEPYPTKYQTSPAISRHATPPQNELTRSLIEARSSSTDMTRRSGFGFEPRFGRSSFGSVDRNVIDHPVCHEPR